MRIILISDNGKRHTRVNFNLNLYLLTPLVLCFLVVASFLLLNKLVDTRNGIEHQLAMGGLAETDRMHQSVPSSLFLTTETKSVKSHHDEPILPYFDKSLTSNHMHLSKSVHLSGVPVNNASLSSRFGYRSDPFSGKKRLHRGVDIAAKTGSKIHSLASGFVVYAGRKGSYGNVIEIQHDKSLITRYAHLKKTLVSRGSVVRKDDVIATLGNTGRSTGPHLHLEVIKNGRNVDPELYFDGSLTSSF